MTRGDLFIVSSPSGAGKTTLIRLVLEDPRIGGTLHFSVSHTTRPPRTGERDGVEYHFVAEAGFRAIEESGGFLEWAVVHGNLYGTSRAEVEPRLEKGLDVLLDIDVQGARRAAMWTRRNFDSTFGGSCDMKRVSSVRFRARSS